MKQLSRSLALAIGLSLAACEGGTGGSVPGIGNTDDSRPYDGIGEAEVLHFTGTEPFWGGEVVEGTLRYSTPENIDGVHIPVQRFAGRNGLSFSGTLDGANFIMAVTPGECSDNMSDRTYPFTVTLEIGSDQRYGCAWTDTQRFTGSEHP